MDLWRYPKWEEKEDYREFSFISILFVEEEGVLVILEVLFPISLNIFQKQPQNTFLTQHLR